MGFQALMSFLKSSLLNINLIKKLMENWKEVLVNQTQIKSLLQFWNPNNWTCAVKDQVSVHKANVHVMLASGTYILQTSKAKFNQYEVSSHCPLCGMEPEDLVHFMLTCE